MLLSTICVIGPHPQASEAQRTVKNPQRSGSKNHEKTTFRNCLGTSKFHKSKNNHPFQFTSKWSFKMALVSSWWSFELVSFHFTDFTLLWFIFKTLYNFPVWCYWNFLVLVFVKYIKKSLQSGFDDIVSTTVLWKYCFDYFETARKQFRIFFGGIGTYLKNALKKSFSEKKLILLTSRGKCITDGSREIHNY